MTLILRHKKGAPLSMEELDGNFEDLDERLQHFEKNSEELESIALVSEKDGNFEITGSKGAILGTVSIPTPKLQFKGPWKEGTPHYTNDLVTHEGALLLCKTPHVGEVFAPQNWTPVFKLQTKSEPTISSLPIYEKADLPGPTLGTLVILISEKDPQLLVGDGKSWKQLTTTHTE